MYLVPLVGFCKSTWLIPAESKACGNGSEVMGMLTEGSIFQIKSLALHSLTGAFSIGKTSCNCQLTSVG